MIHIVLITLIPRPSLALAFDCLQYTVQVVEDCLIENWSGRMTKKQG